MRFPFMTSSAWVLARMLRGLVTLPGGPCVIVLCHPIKNASEQSQLLPRGGGAFLNETDGNLTAWKDRDLVDMWWTGKFRGPGFEPITFRLEKIKTPALVDSKGRMIPTVRAVPVTEQEKETDTLCARSDEDRLLIAMLSSARSIAQLARECGWVSETGQPQKSKVHRIMDGLSADHLVEQHRGEYRLTKEGKAVAEKALASMADIAPAAF
jgi:hypothetical protein